MIHHGDLFDVLPTLPAASVDACVTDPPYGIGFMGKEWDTFKPENVRTAAAMKQRKNPAQLAELKNVYGRKWSPAQSPSQVAYDYGLDGLRGFQTWTERWACEVFRVVKPGAYIVVCCAPRSYHRMACGLEDAGFVVRDQFAWLFLSGFPKSLNFGCKCGGNAGPYSHAGLSTPERDVRRVQLTDVPETVNAGSESRQVLLEGLSEQGISAHGETDGSGLNARGEQPSVEGRELHRAGEGLPDDSDAGASSGAGERLRAGAHRNRGADTRPEAEAGRGSASQGPGPGEQRPGKSASLRLPSRTLDSGASERGSRCARCGGLTSARGQGTALKPSHEPICLARKPFKGTIADNYIRYGTGALNIDATRIPFNGPEDAAAAAAAAAHRNGDQNKNRRALGDFNGRAADTVATYQEGVESGLGRWPANTVVGEGAALDVAPYLYVAKPSREERDYGCHELVARTGGEATDRKDGSAGLNNPRAGAGRTGGSKNFHPTVKPVELMRWLVRLVTPPGGVVLDPFGGSFTTAMACAYEQRKFVIIEREADYVEIGVKRVRAVNPLFADADALRVTHWPSGAARTPADVPRDGSDDPEVQDSDPSRSACPDPYDAAVAPAGQGHE